MVVGYWMGMDQILLIAAAVCFAIAAIPLPVRFGIGWLGLFFWVLTLII